MKANHWYIIVFLLIAIALCGSTVVIAQSKAISDTSSVTYDLKENQTWNPASAQWMDVPVFAPGAKMKVINGDAAKGPSDLYVWFPAKYGVRWHFHTPTEKVFMQSGTMEIEIRENGKKATLGPGGYFLSPSRSIHRATCIGSTDCYFFVHSAGPFDINIVDETGKIIKSGPHTEVAKKQ